VGRRKKSKKRRPVKLEVVNSGPAILAAEAMAPEVPDPEVSERPVRRSFTAAYKLRILKEADAAKEEGEVGALLRREGLYSSHLTTWRRARERGELKGLAARRRGPKPREDAAQAREVKRLEREVARLTKELEQARLLIDVQKKLSEMLGIEMPKIEDDE
jgi:transposase-like protein